MADPYENYMEENLVGFAGNLGEWMPLGIAVLSCLLVSIMLVKSVKALIKLMKAQRKAEDEFFYRSKDGIAFSEIDGNYRVVNGFLVKLNMEQQERFMPGRSAYEKARDVGNMRSVIFRDASGLQKLLDEKAGTGDLVATNKEKVDFGTPIGQYMDPESHSKLETSVGVIHYTADGAYIVPARPSARRL
ncbi:MAG: hypothetical protein J6M66_02880 [Lachnospiraceae bacterium]|nr:hypothetical protein [Lachnospiraceae bacterium]